MRITLDLNSIIDYERFIAVKQLPQYRIVGRTVAFPDEYAARLGYKLVGSPGQDYAPVPGMFDYQRDIVATAIVKRKYAIFADCGLGKTLMLLEFARHVADTLPSRRVLIISPLMVIRQTLVERDRWYGDGLPIDKVAAADLAGWLTGGGESRVGITNYESLKVDTPQGQLGALILDESSMLKSHYGKWGTACLRLGRGLEYKLCCTGTPAPNDRIEYANHAVFLDAFPTVNSFLARFFVNRGQTDNRWELKPHALGPFYRALSHWCIFVTNPKTYGWHDNTATLPPIHVHIQDVRLTPEQRRESQDRTGTLLMSNIGGITSRARMATLAKGFIGNTRIPTNKPKAVRELVASWPDESTIIWCLYNNEQRIMEETFPEAVSITGATPYELRQKLVDAFLAGDVRVLITKPRILGFGLNLQIATRQVFSGLQDSYESYYQAVKRSNRFGATRPLNVHIPITELERPMIETVLAKANRIERDTTEQERIFRDVR